MTDELRYILKQMNRENYVLDELTRRANECRKARRGESLHLSTSVRAYPLDKYKHYEPINILVKGELMERVLNTVIEFYEDECAKCDVALNELLHKMQNLNHEE